MCDDPSHVSIAAFEELAAVTLGTRRTPLHGGGRDPDGLTHRMATVERITRETRDTVDYLRQTVDNGGIHIRLTKAQWTAVTAIVTAVSALVRAVL